MYNRISELDGIRGLAALIVVIYHYTTRFNEIYGYNIPLIFELKYGNLGVNLFFMVSGFVIYMTLNKTNNVWNFAKKRLLRLYPVYVIAVIITFLTVFLFGLEGREVTYVDAVINLTMLQGFIPHVPHVDGAYWSLTIELTFYGIIAILIVTGLIKRIYLVMIIWLFLNFGLKLLDIFYTNKIIDLLTSLTLANFSHLFIAGIVYYLIREKAEPKHYIILFMCIIYQFSFNSLIESTIVSLFFIVFHLLIINKLSFLKFKPFVFLGTISYSLYLIHQNIGYIIINNLQDNEITSISLIILIPLIISVTIAVVLTYFVEIPFQNYLRKRRKTLNVIDDIKDKEAIS